VPISGISAFPRIDNLYVSASFIYEKIVWHVWSTVTSSFHGQQILIACNSYFTACFELFGREQDYLATFKQLILRESRKAEWGRGRM